MVLQRIHKQIITSTDTGGESTCKFVTVDTWREYMYKLVTTDTYLGILEGTPENTECGITELWIIKIEYDLKYIKTNLNLIHVQLLMH